jgi:hypothetical protein
MFRPTRLAALLMLLVGSVAFAQNPPPAMAFTWNTYKGSDGKDYTSPSWNADGNDVYLKLASGTLNVGADWTATSGKMAIQVPGPLPGSWVGLFEDPNIGITAKSQFNEHVLTGVDPNQIKKRIPSGSDYRATWTVKVKDKGNNEVTVTLGPYQGKAEAK